MKKRRLREIEEENNAALKIQLAWRRKKDKWHMKRRLKAEREEMKRAAIVIQNAYRRRDAKVSGEYEKAQTPR